MVDVPPIPFFPEWESKYLPRQRMTQREAGRRAHEKQKNFDAAMAGYMRQQAALGAGRGYQDLGATGLLGVTTPADMIDLTTLGASIPLMVKAAGATSIGRHRPGTSGTPPRGSWSTWTRWTGEPGGAPAIHRSLEIE